MYYEILIFCVLLVHISLTLPLFKQCFFSISTFLFQIFQIKIILSAPFQKLTKTAIKKYSAKYVCF